ncbi:MAG: lysozyme inhibitor LprI family protein, partial [bacterium]|nr:lysozyme inhibitor LprI family protein [bacterium]
MSASRLATLAVALCVLAPAAYAGDDYTAAASRAPTRIKLCGNADGDRIKAAACADAGYDKLVARIDRAFDAALPKAAANIRPLLKRDQVWFNEMILEAADLVVEMDDADLRANFAEMLQSRAAALEGNAEGFARAGIAGRWSSAFGSIAATPAEGDAYRLAVNVRVNYGSDRHAECSVGALVRPGAGGWLTGSLLPGEAAKADAKSEPKKPPTLKLRRQGETLRVVIVADKDGSYDELPGCESVEQITASYFPNGQPEASAARTDAAFVTPTFDCARPETATDEEICADPDLADNDQRLNRAWKALLPRLDNATRRTLTDDQRNWIKSQAAQFPQFLHPAWEKRSSQMHYTTDARAHVDGLQRERIALLEGFDDKRPGLAGVWLAYNAVLKITANADGTLTGQGWKWEQGDWKAGCDYAMTGKLVKGTFRSDEARQNPDTLERDHASLIVNRLDDAFAKKRWKKDGTEDESADEAKCRRNLSNSSTARLFPARPSPDIDNLGGSIR